MKVTEGVEGSFTIDHQMNVYVEGKPIDGHNQHTDVYVDYYEGGIVLGFQTKNDAEPYFSVGVDLTREEALKVAEMIAQSVISFRLMESEGDAGDE